MNKKIKYDVAVMGGGPAGMMAAGRAAECGARVILVEKNPKLGRKLLLAGGGRCNVTNFKPEREFINCLGKNGKFLFSAFHNFDSKEVMEFFSSRGLKMKVENNDRVFPVTDNGTDVLDVLLNYLHDQGVEIKTNCQVTDIIADDNKIERVATSCGDIKASAYIIATGGLSYAATGSTGDGFSWAKKLGHTVVPTRPALVSMICREKIVKELQGLSFDDVTASFSQAGLPAEALAQAGKKIFKARGEMIFTHEGVSGPMILNASRQVGALMENGEVEMHVDFFPDDNNDLFDKKIEKLLSENPNRSVKNCLNLIAPQKLAGLLMKLVDMDDARKANSVSREERQKISAMLKKFVLHISALGGWSGAMVTAGGIALSEVDQKTMKSKIIDNLYLAGEVLDLDGPTGGFNLQICWSTGYVAGENAATHSSRCYSDR